MLPYDTGKFHGIPVGADSISARHCKMCKYIGGKTMKSSNIPEVKLGIIAVSRDCFPIALSEKRRAAISAACAAKGTDLYECKTTVENEHDMQKAVAEVTAAGCNALTVFLGNFGPETPETLIAKYFDGPCMFVAAAEGDGDMINGRGDAYCGMLNCSYNLGILVCYKIHCERQPVTCPRPGQTRHTEESVNHLRQNAKGSINAPFIGQVCFNKG